MQQDPKQVVEQQRHDRALKVLLVTSKLPIFVIYNIMIS